uniref:LCN-type CS-alpha/beta domain-containing protein n=1 Tax=Isometrus maculatus TaxID=497827 RepID=A0A0U1SSL3_ISOMC|nr:hypothetical protein [Isometrus maculatus]
MKFCFAIFLLIIASKEIKSGIVSGIGEYPRDFAGNHYYCGVWAAPDCSKVCKLHGVEIGYCDVKKSFCEHLPKDRQNFWSIIWRQCRK